MTALIAVCCAAGCDRPGGGDTATASVIVPAAPAVLPDAVQAMVNQLAIVATQRDWRAMARLAAAHANFRSNDGGMSARDYWRLKVSAGDDPTVQLGRLLIGSPAVVGSGPNRVYVWPALAALKPAAVTPQVERRIDALLGAGKGAAFKRGVPWPGYSLGIRADGAWLWFITGEG